MSLTIARFTAFNDSGRFNVIQAILSFTSYKTLSSAIYMTPILSSIDPLLAHAVTLGVRLEARGASKTKFAFLLTPHASRLMPTVLSTPARVFLQTHAGLPYYPRWSRASRINQ